MRIHLVRCPRGHGRLGVDAECGAIASCQERSVNADGNVRVHKTAKKIKDHVTWWGLAEPHQVFLFLCVRLMCGCGRCLAGTDRPRWAMRRVYTALAPRESRPACRERECQR